jgi:hypothetical protein
MINCIWLFLYNLGWALPAEQPLNFFPLYETIGMARASPELIAREE